MKPLEQSLKLQAKARKIIPGASQLLSKRPDQFSLGVWPGYFAKAKGVEVWDLDGNRYIDMSIGGIGATVLGYADPDIDRAVTAAIKKGVSSSLNCPEEVELAEVLCSLHPWAKMARFARTGGEAMAVAIRIARAHTGRNKIAFCGYHGWHDWYLAANLGGKNALGEHLLSGLSPQGVPEQLTGTSFPFRYNHSEELASIIKEHGRDLAAVVMEPVRNIDPEPGFLEEVKRLTKDAGAVFIFDEISAGFRLTTGGAHLKFKVYPDMAVFSKALGNGYPIAAVIGTESVMSSAQTTFISSTNWTERVGPTAALAMIKKFRRLKTHAHLNKMGRMVQEGWANLAKKHGIKMHIGGIYPLSHFIFEYEDALVMKAYFVQEMLAQGFLVSNLFYAMAAHKPWQVTAYLKATDRVWQAMMDFQGKGTLSHQLNGQPAVSGFKRLN